MHNKIKSRDNPKLKNVRKIRDGKAFEKIFIEGLRLCEEFIRSEIEIIECFIDKKFGSTDRETDLLKIIESKCPSINEVETNLFQSIADTQNPQGIILIGKKPQYSFKDSGVENNRYLFLFEINNPSNLGAILRTAEAAGVGGVILSKNSTDVYSPKSLRASMGAGFRLPIWEQADFYDVLKWAKENNFITTAADINADRKYYEIDWSVKRLIIFGSEAEGLNEEQRKSIDELIYIPMENSVESLNLAVSCGIILFEAKK